MLEPEHQNQRQGQPENVLSSPELAAANATGGMEEIGELLQEEGARYAQIEKDNIELKEENKSLRTERANIELQVHGDRTRIILLEKDKSELMERIKKMSTGRTASSDDRAKIVRLEEEKAELLETIKNMRAKVESSTSNEPTNPSVEAVPTSDEIKKFEKDIDLLKDQLGEVVSDRDHRDRLQMNLKMLRAEHIKLKFNHARLQRDAERVENELKQQQVGIDNAKTERDAVAAINEELTARRFQEKHEINDSKPADPSAFDFEKVLRWFGISRSQSEEFQRDLQRLEERLHRHVPKPINNPAFTGWRNSTQGSGVVPSGSRRRRVSSRMLSSGQLYETLESLPRVDSAPMSGWANEFSLPGTRPQTAYPSSYPQTRPLSRLGSPRQSLMLPARSSTRDSQCSTRPTSRKRTFSSTTEDGFREKYYALFPKTAQHDEPHFLPPAKAPPSAAYHKGMNPKEFAIDAKNSSQKSLQFAVEAPSSVTPTTVRPKMSGLTARAALLEQQHSPQYYTDPWRSPEKTDYGLAQHGVEPTIPEDFARTVSPLPEERDAGDLCDEGAQSVLADEGGMNGSSETISTRQAREFTRGVKLAQSDTRRAEDDREDQKMVIDFSLHRHPTSPVSPQHAWGINAGPGDANQEAIKTVTTANPIFATDVVDIPESARVRSSDIEIPEGLDVMKVLDSPIGGCAVSKKLQLKGKALDSFDDGKKALHRSQAFASLEGRPIEIPKVGGSPPAVPVDFRPVQGPALPGRRRTHRRSMAVPHLGIRNINTDDELQDVAKEADLLDHTDIAIPTSVSSTTRASKRRSSPKVAKAEEATNTEVGVHVAGLLEWHTPTMADRGMDAHPDASDTDAIRRTEQVLGELRVVVTTFSEWLHNIAMLWLQYLRRLMGQAPAWQSTWQQLAWAIFFIMLGVNFVLAMTLRDEVDSWRSVNVSPRMRNHILGVREGYWGTSWMSLFELAGGLGDVSVLLV